MSAHYYIMKASLLDLRRKTNKVVEAIDKNQKVTLTRRGKTFAVICSCASQTSKASSREGSSGFWDACGVAEQGRRPRLYLKKIRSNRYAL